MKRVLFLVFVLLLMLPICKAKAACDFDEQYKLNIIGSNIKYYYEYVKDETIFDVKLYNVRKEVYLEIQKENQAAQQISMDDVEALKNLL